MKYFSRVLELATYTPFYWLCKCEIHVCWILNKMWKIHFVILTYVLVILKKNQSILIDVLIYHLIRENSNYMWMRIHRNVKLKYLCHVSGKFQNLSSAYPNELYLTLIIFVTKNNVWSYNNYIRFSLNLFDI